MRTELRKALVAGSLGLALLASGCGGGRLSTLDFQAKANGICARTNAKVRSAYAGVPQDPVSLGRAIKKAIGYTKKGTDELDELNPPKTYEAQFDRFVRIRRNEVVSGRRLAQAAERRDQAGLVAARTQLVLEGRDESRLAKQMGLNICAQH